MCTFSPFSSGQNLSICPHWLGKYFGMSGSSFECQSDNEVVVAKTDSLGRIVCLHRGQKVAVGAHKFCSCVTGKKSLNSPTTEYIRTSVALTLPFSRCSHSQMTFY